ncbi:MAG: hypothetical protein WB440_19755 [Steroidobacteraceae bacterium]
MNWIAARGDLAGESSTLGGQRLSLLIHELSLDVDLRSGGGSGMSDVESALYFPTILHVLRLATQTATPVAVAFKEAIDVTQRALVEAVRRLGGESGTLKV